MKLPGRVWIWIHRTQNRWHDVRAMASGYCNDCPRKNGLPDEGGGYRHWRCALRRGHDGMHRYRNYVWTGDGATDYLPVPNGWPMPSQPWDRKHVRTMRQARLDREWHERQHAKRRAARKAGHR